MLRQKAKCFQPRTLSLEELVPPNQFLPQTGSQPRSAFRL